MSDISADDEIRLVSPTLPPEAVPPQQIGDLELNHETHRAFWRGVRVALSHNEFRIVRFLATAGQEVTYRQIFEVTHPAGLAYGTGPDGFRPNVRTAIKRLRLAFCAIDPGFDGIETYTNFGYRWRA